jgi:hypothetical protein
MKCEYLGWSDFGRLRNGNGEVDDVTSAAIAVCVASAEWLKTSIERVWHGLEKP